MRLDDQFSLKMPFWRFAGNTALASLLSMLPLLAVYVALRPGFAALLVENGLALSRFLRQVLTNGFPVVFVVNYVGFFLFAWAKARPQGVPNRSALVLTDAAIRIIAFYLLHVAIYVGSADWFGSFGGSKATALRVVAPTLARSAIFDNISGVYLYAALLPALPVWAAIWGRSRRDSAADDGLPGTARPWLAAAATCLAAAFALSALAWLLARLQAG